MNKKIVFMFILLALAVVVSMSCMAKRNIVAMQEGTIERYEWDVDESENADGRIQDATITSAIKMKFAEDKLVSSSRINVDTTNGSVTLNGKVSSQEKVDRAIQLGRSVEGVKLVRSNLSIQS